MALAPRSKHERIGDEVALLRSDGFALLRDTLVDPDLSLVRSCYDNFLARRLEGARSYQPSGAHILIWAKFTHWEERVFGLLRPGAIARVLAARYFDVAVDEITTGFRAFYKPSHIGAETPWHQDIAYADSAAISRSLNVWFALDDCGEESGCMRYVRGSQAGPFLPHSEERDPSGGLTLSTYQPLASDVRSMPVSSGSIIAHDWRTLHQSGRNTSAYPRRALVAVCRLAREAAAAQSRFDGRNRNF